MLDRRFKLRLQLTRLTPGLHSIRGTLVLLLLPSSQSPRCPSLRVPESREPMTLWLWISFWSKETSFRKCLFLLFYFILSIFVTFWTEGLKMCKYKLSISIYTHKCNSHKLCVFFGSCLKTSLKFLTQKFLTGPKSMKIHTTYFSKEKT